MTYLNTQQGQLDFALSPNMSSVSLQKFAVGAKRPIKHDTNFGKTALNRAGVWFAIDGC